LPVGIPGYGKPFGVIADGRMPHADAAGLALGNFLLAPELQLSQGYDSAPNGGAASSVTSVAPSVLLSNPVLGFAAFAATNISEYPENTSQNATSVTLGAGERVALPRETVTVSTGFLRAQETGFAIDTVAISRPITFTLSDVRASDEITAGVFTIEPEASATFYRFPGFAAQNRNDDREAVTGFYAPGGPVQLLLRLHFTQSNYREAIFDAQTTQLLAGLTDTANGLWTLRALAGVARRAPRVGGAITAPVLEAGLDWMPGDLDRLRLTLVREIDDPDEVSAAAYTLSQADISLEHQFPEGITTRFSFQAAAAAYFHSDLRESIFSSDANISWPLGSSLALTGDYTFNDRQANYLRAANEHVVTLGLAWTP
jgi:hypothetical protein